jgi:hypothetical protein
MSTKQENRKLQEKWLIFENLNKIVYPPRVLTKYCAHDWKWWLLISIGNRTSHYDVRNWYVSIKLWAPIEGALSIPFAYATQDFGRSENGGGSAGSPHYYTPPQIFRTSTIPDRQGRGEADFGPALTAHPPRFLAPRTTPPPPRFSDLVICLILFPSTLQQASWPQDSHPQNPATHCIPFCRTR